MKKYILIALLVLIALVLGFLIGQNTSPIERLKIVKEQVVDTVFQAKLIEVKVEKPIKQVDTVFLSSRDTAIKLNAFTELKEPDTLEIGFEPEVDSIQIIQDKKIKSETLELIMVNEEEIDTLLEKLLNVETIKQRQILVEYWESPLNYTGYKLSKSKLIVYGITPLSKGLIYKNQSQYYFKSNNLFYELTETADFKTMMQISKPTIIND